MAPDSKKIKKPPTFHHLPAHKAKKLKQSWVQSQKIRSQWAAQKRREGLQPFRSAHPKEDDTHTHKVPDEGDVDQAAVQPSHREPGTNSQNGNRDEGGDSEDSASDDQVDQSTTRRRSPRPPTRGRPGLKGQGGGHTAPNPPNGSGNQQGGVSSSLRELHNKAYARSSLHTHKSDPLHRHRGGAQKFDTRVDVGLHHRGQRGRGQPDMRLRMNAMLEKIKRDTT